ncbi:hypothetical protein DFJ74DRAFT_661339 [Hyaloraphidium curvatum]|nr:hypothetical protein DFJ74DRAFT_661339 [Hyaloraphidium curvatum]
MEDFTPAEWAAIVPEPCRSLDALYPSADGPGAPPLPAAALLREVGKRSRALVFALRLQLKLLPWTSRIALRCELYCFLGAAASLSLLAFDTGYGKPQLVAGLFAVLFDFATTMVFIVVFAGDFGSWRTFARPAARREKVDAPEADFSGHALAGLARWSAIAGDGEDTSDKDKERDPGAPAASLLVRHDSSDALCSCADCVASILQSAPWLHLLDLFIRLCVAMLRILFIMSSPIMVVPAYWRTPWAVLGAAAVLAGVNYGVFNVIGRFSTSVSLLRLSLRVRRRATLLGLRELLDWCRASLAESGDSEAPSAREPRWDKAPDLYMRLHRRLADSWSFRIPFLTAPPLLIGVGVFNSVVSLCANIVAGSCIPLYVFFMLLLVLALTVIDIVNLSLSNQQIDAIAGLYREARARIREMLVSHPDLPTKTYRELRNHDALLESFLGVEGFRAKFLGFVVGFGVLRTFVITIFTVGIGLFSLLRGSVFVPVDSVCPTRS